MSGDARPGARPDPTPPLATRRLALEPLVAAHAAECYADFADPALYALMEGKPPASVEALAAEFARLAHGSGRAGEAWHNWIARASGSGRPVGWHQATVTGARADIAWVTFPAARRRGYAREGAAALLAWFASIGVAEVIAQADLRNAGSEATARALGFAPDPAPIASDLRGEATVDRVWRLRLVPSG